MANVIGDMTDFTVRRCMAPPEKPTDPMVAVGFNAILPDGQSVNVQVTFTNETTYHLLRSLLVMCEQTDRQEMISRVNQMLRDMQVR